MNNAKSPFVTVKNGYFVELIGTIIAWNAQILINVNIKIVNFVSIFNLIQ